MANCNLSGNGCKVRGRVGGVAAERSRLSNADNNGSGRMDFIFLLLCRRGFEKHGFPDKENCNLSGRCGLFFYHPTN